MYALGALDPLPLTLLPNNTRQRSAFHLALPSLPATAVNARARERLTHPPLPFARCLPYKKSISISSLHTATSFCILSTAAVSMSGSIFLTTSLIFQKNFSSG